MYRGECALTFMVYQLILIAGPIDISKQHLLQKNQRIYAILFCLMGAIKLTIQGLIFDNYIDHIILGSFFYNRGCSILFGILASLALIPIVKDEMSEITQNTKLYIVNRVQKKPKQKVKPPKTSGIISGSSSARNFSDELGPRDFKSSSHSNYNRPVPPRVKTRSRRTFADESFSDSGPLMEKTHKNYDYMNYNYN